MFIILGANLQGLLSGNGPPIDLLATQLLHCLDHPNRPLRSCEMDGWKELVEQSISEVLMDNNSPSISKVGPIVTCKGPSLFTPYDHGVCFLMISECGILFILGKGL